jgi:hypothetical protein
MSVVPKLYISQAVLVVNHEQISDIRIKQPEIEKLFNTIIEAQSENSNVLDSDPPNIPRIIMRSDKIHALFSQNVTQFIMLVNNNNDKNIKTIFDSLKNKIVKLKDILNHFTTKDKQISVGVVFTLRYSFDLDITREKIAYCIHNKFINGMSQYGKPINVQFLLGYETDSGNYMNFSASMYEAVSKRINFSDFNGKSVAEFPIHQDDITERGVELSLDINNISAPTKNNDVVLFINEVEDFLLNHADSFIDVASISHG